MSSMIRRMQIKLWKAQNKKPFDHNGNHGGLSNGVPVLAWPLQAKDFNNHDQ